MIIGDESDLKKLKEAGARLRRVLDVLESKVAEGVSTTELDRLARVEIAKLNAKPSFLNYKPAGHMRPYPAAICTSVNEEVVHGVPNENPRILKSGDLLTIDCGLIYEGVYVDSARTVPVGALSEELEKLVRVAREARDAQIKACKAGATIYELGLAVEKTVKNAGFYSPEILGGHGVGLAVHEEPFVPNFADKSMTRKIKKGEVLALEPIVIKGTSCVKLKSDGYTYVSEDSSPSAQFEHTVVALEDRAEIVT